MAMTRTMKARVQDMAGMKGNGGDHPEPQKDPSNPFIRPVTTVEAEPALDRSPILGDRMTLVGASHVPAETEEPTKDAPQVQADAGYLNLIGASGGVGVSTLAAVCSERVIDTSEDEPAAGAAGVVVASVSRGSLAAAERLRVEDSTNTLTGLVLVHHRRTEDVSANTRAYAKRVARLYPRSFEVRYEPRWPDAEGPVTASWAHRRRFTHLVKTLNAWAEPLTPHEKE